MIVQNVELHNVAEAVSEEGTEGVLLQRVPQRVLEETRPGTQMCYKVSASCEIRFVSDWKPVKVTLQADRKTQVYFYMGDFAVSPFELGTEQTTIELAMPDMPNYLMQQGFDRAPYPFDPKVWRLVFYFAQIRLIRVEGESVRPPLREELPRLRYLAYGTSITQGVQASHPALKYVKQAGHAIRADVLNLGASGNAFMEPALVDYIAGRDDWDIATLEVSVNMLNQGVSASEFADRARYMVHTLAKRQPGKPIVCIGLFPSIADLELDFPKRSRVSSSQEYRETLRRIVEETNLDHVYYVDGRELLASMDGLTYDLLHPGDQGMIEIGSKLGTILRRIINGIN